MTGAIPRETIIVVYDGVVLLDVAGPLQVLHSAGGYRIRLASSDGSAVTTNVGTPLGAHMALPQLDGSVHTLIVPGYAPGGPRPGKDVVDHVRRAGSRATRVASVCTGAFLLAEAGLLVGRRATTHWAVCDELAGRFPEVAVQPDAIYVRDGKVVTSAGMTAGIDLALALVDEDLGPDTARAIARWMVVFLQRPGGQSQFSVRATTGTPRNAALRRVLDAVAADPAGDHSLAAMAGVAAVSPRHLSRLFRRQLRSTRSRSSRVRRPRMGCSARRATQSGTPIPGHRAVPAWASSTLIEPLWTDGHAVIMADHRDTDNRAARRSPNPSSPASWERAGPPIVRIRYATPAGSPAVTRTSSANVGGTPLAGTVPSDTVRERRPTTLRRLTDLPHPRVSVR